MLKALLLLFGCLCMLSPCAAQEVEVGGKGGALFSPTGFVEITIPISNRVAVNTFGFYVGSLQAGITILEVPWSVHKHFTLTPGYLFLRVPPSGISVFTNQPGSQSFTENQFRLAGTISTTFHTLMLSDRNMYVRQFTSAGGVNSYRNRVYLGRKFILGSYTFTPFVFDEVHFNFASGNRMTSNLVVAGANLPINGHLTFEPSFIRQDEQHVPSGNFLGLALIINTGKLFHTSKKPAAGDATHVSP
jgi:hypothetical protein